MFIDPGDHDIGLWIVLFQVSRFSNHLCHPSINVTRAALGCTHCAKLVVQTNLPSIGKTHIFRTGMKSTFTWTTPYKSISVLIIT